ncbi:MAG: IS66 family transposase [Deltaproteobacteria bacterium]|nr:IS66 family transposase [Deltaproteobacteria bacterium]
MQEETLDRALRQNSEQAKQLAEQAKRIIELEAVVVELKERLDENSSNSSKPPSSDSPSTREKNRAKRKRRAATRKRGGQPGHKGSCRQLLPHEEVDETKSFFPPRCENCWCALAEIPCEAPKRYQVTEFTQGHTTITEYQRHWVLCPCGHKTWADYTDEIPRSAFGPRLSSVVAMLTGVYHLSRRETQRLLDELLGVEMSLGVISSIEKRVSAALKPVYEQAQELADAAAIKHTDGTGWRQAGTALQLWTVATSRVSVFSIVKNGTAATVRSLFGRIKGILVSDRASAFNFWRMKRRQICWSHLLRKFISFSERDGPGGRMGTELVEATGILFETYKLFVDGNISRRIFRQRMAPLRTQIEATLQRAQDANIKRMSGSCKNMLKHKEALWTFVDRSDVEPTNNHAERELRAFVLWRKKSFGTQSDSGNRFAERLMTVTHSLRKQQRPILPFLVAAMRGLCSSQPAPLLQLPA